MGLCSQTFACTDHPQPSDETRRQGLTVLAQWAASTATHFTVLQPCARPSLPGVTFPPGNLLVHASGASTLSALIARPRSPIGSLEDVALHLTAHFGIAQVCWKPVVHRTRLHAIANRKS
jgi:hypothetical protein